MCKISSTEKLQNLKFINKEKYIKINTNNEMIRTFRNQFVYTGLDIHLVGSHRTQYTYQNLYKIYIC